VKERRTIKEISETLESHEGRIERVMCWDDTVSHLFQNLMKGELKANSLTFSKESTSSTSNLMKGELKERCQRKSSLTPGLAESHEGRIERLS